MRRHWVIGAVLLGALAPEQVIAFGTIDIHTDRPHFPIPNQNREHERITRHAVGCGESDLGTNCFQPSSLNELAGARGTFGAVGAPDNPFRGPLRCTNQRTRLCHLLDSAEAHCDNGDYLPDVNYPREKDPDVKQGRPALEACRVWMKDHINEAVRDAGRLLNKDGEIDDSEIPTVFSCTYNGVKGRAKCNVLEDFGITLHAVQDFYSHSNWTDTQDHNPSPDNPVKRELIRFFEKRPIADLIADPDTGKPLSTEIPALLNPPGLENAENKGMASWLDLRNEQPAFPQGLISGCYFGNELNHCDNRVKHYVLNKDTGDIEPVIGIGKTPRGMGYSNFAKAVNAAIADTRAKWIYLQDRLTSEYGSRKGNLMICALTHDNPARTCKGEKESYGSRSSSFRFLGILAMFLAFSGYKLFRGSRSLRPAAATREPC